MKITVGQLLNLLKDAPLETPVTFQANEPGEDDILGDDPSYTVSTGYVYNGFLRDGEFVIDAAITESEL